jgi:hypothetical protein
LRCREFLDQILATYGNFHRCPLRGRLLNFSFEAWHFCPPAAEAASYALTVQQLAGVRERRRSITPIVAMSRRKGAWKTGEFSELQEIGSSQ